MNHFDGVCLTRATFTSSSSVLLQINGPPNTTMHNDEAGDIFIFECSRIPDLLCGKCPKSKQAYLLCFFEPGEAEQNYLWRQIMN